MMSELKFYATILLQRLPLMLVIFFATTAAAIYLAVSLPAVYVSSARLLVEAAQIPDQLASSTVQTNANEQLEIIQQRVLTRANLIDIARRHNVYGEPLSPDELVTRMRADTTFRSTSGRDRATVTTLSFSARSGQIAANVVNDLVTQVLNENVRLRTDTAGGTLAFFEQEVSRLGVELDRQSARIIEFQNANIDALPEGQSYRLSRQSALQERLVQIRRELTDLDNQRTNLVRLFSATGQGGGASPSEQRLAQARDELAQARLIYSDTNPRVRLLQAQVARLETAHSETLAQPDAGAGGGAPVDAGAEDVAEEDGETAAGDAAEGSFVSTGSPTLDLQLAEIDSRRAFLSEQIPLIEAEMAQLIAAIEATPANSIAIDGLRRDYENVQSQYNAARVGLAQAATGERIELSSRGQRISVIEQANPPSSPSSPNRKLIVAAGGVAGLGAAGGLVLLMELLNRAVRRPSDLVRKLDITPLATIPYIPAAGETTRRVSIRLLTVVLLAGALIAGLYLVNQYYMPLELVLEQIRGRIGL